MRAAKKISAISPTAAYSRNVPVLPSAPTRDRKVNETRKLNAQFAMVHSDIAGLRRCKGKISKIINQNTGPSPMAKLAM